MTSFTPCKPGTVFQDRYEIRRLIGRGGMSAVYEVYDRNVGARRALKQVLPTEPALRTALEHEAQLLANLQHEALPYIIERFSDGDSYFIVMQYIEGKDLDQLVHEQGPMPLDRVMRWADQLLGVLVYLHSRQPAVIHRDIKPQNLKLTERERIVLLDFGIAKGRPDVTTTTSGDDSVLAWTPHYAPPEQILNEGTDARSDLFAVAATLYHLLSSSRPLEARKRLAAVNDGSSDPLKPVHEVYAQVPRAISDVLHQAMALSRTVRPESAAAFRTALRTAYEHASEPSAPPVAPTEIPTTPSAEDVHPRVPGSGAKHHTSEPSLAAGDAPDKPSPAGGWGGYGSGAGVVRSSSQNTLQKRLHTLIRQVLDSYPGAWLVWCDPRGDWQPLLQRVATDNRMGGFPLVVVTEQTAGAVGSLTARQTVQAHIDAEESFVLLINAAPDALGWLWAQALLAEQLYTRSLREQLLAWGWQLYSLTITDDEVALLAQQEIQQDPAEWGGGGLHPDLRLLLDVLAGGDTPEPHQQLLLDMTISYVGLPPLAEHDLAIWRSRSLARLLITQAHAVAPSLIPTTHDLLIAEGQRPQALHLLERWRDSLRLSRGLPDAILEADRIAVLGPLLEQASSAHGPFLSHAAEMTVFATTCHRLAQQQGKTLLHALAILQDDVQRHIQGLWGAITNHPQAIAWNDLLRLSQAAQTLLTVIPDEWTDLDAAIAWYTGGGWQLDQAGDDMLRNLPQAAAALLSLVTALREAFRARWEHTLIQWSDLWIQAGCPIPNLPTAGEWLKAYLDSSQPTALLVIDALRYDLGAGLVAAVNQREGAERATLTPARAPLLSITALGMGYAMPLHETDLRAELVGSTWHLWHEPSQTDLSRAANRRAWWQAQQHLAAENLLMLPDALSGPLPQPTRQRARLVITDALIDKLGHDDELDVLGPQVAHTRYVDVIMRLRDSGWQRILVVTDHGFIHWSGSSEKSMPPPHPNPAYKSRRALAYPTTTPVTAPNVHAPGGDWRIVPAQGAATWSSYGGLGYFHGGASLQEWIIPCIAITWPGKAAALEVTLQPLNQILTQRPRVTLLIQRASLFPEDAVARPVEVVIRETAHQTVLFRSARVELRPDHDQQTVPLQPVSGASAARGTALRIEVRDAQTEAVLADSTSTLLIALDEW